MGEPSTHAEASNQNPIGDADTLEWILDAWHDEASIQVPEFWSCQVLESLSHLFGTIMASMNQGEVDEDGEHRARMKSLLVEIRDLLDQLWWADWPAISLALEREIRDLVARVRENEAEKRKVWVG